VPSRGKLVAGASAIALMSGLLGGAVGASLADRDTQATPSTSVPTATAPAAVPDVPPDSVAGIANAVLPSVVSIATGTGTGSGVIVSEDGTIVTNNHVISAAANGGEITVRLQDGRTLDATLVGRSPAYDLAVLDVDGEDLPAAPLGTSSNLVVGQPVVAVGSPLGLDGTVTSGIISALNRPVTAGDRQDEVAFINAVQTDAAINPGNSGGPLLDAEGRIIGINSAIVTLGSSLRQGGSIGLGFAIPADQVSRTLQEILETGQATYPIIGASLQFPFDGIGAAVQEVTPGGPAAEAGIRAGDVITEIDGRQVTTGEELIVLIRDRRPGQVVELTVERGGSREQVRVELGAVVG
jgi:putative serine protease PepD